jgi:hypothetical protein
MQHLMFAMGVGHCSLRCRLNSRGDLKPERQSG